MDICPKCGLSKELCVCEALDREKEKISVSKTAKSYGKIVTLVSGLGKDSDIRGILKELKTRLACGGTVKDGVIVLQGNHIERVMEILIKLGFAEDQIAVS